MKKYNTKINVYDAAKARIKDAILHFDDYYVSFSGGKDSGVLLNLVIEAATELNRLPVKTVFSDLECVFSETVRYTQTMMERPEVDPYWLCFDEIDENASSVFERYYRMWDREHKEKWVRPMPDMPYVINNDNCPPELWKYLNLDSMDNWSIEPFGEYLCDISGAKNICNFLGIRSVESYGRHMIVATASNRNKYNQFTYKTKDSERTWISVPIYDWEFADVWLYFHKNKLDYNHVYDDFFQLGIPESQMRTCFAFGEEQKKQLHIWQKIEPQTWNRLVQRVEGANFGKIYNHTNMNRGKIKKPDNITWKEYLDILMNELPPLTRSNFEDKFKITFRYHKVYYEEKEGISPEIYIQDSRADERDMKKKGWPGKIFITYEDLCNAIIKRDFVFKKYGFGYSKKMDERITKMQNEWRKAL